VQSFEPGYKRRTAPNPDSAFPMRFNWHVQQIGNMCIITREDGVIHQVAPRRRLRQQMEPHGVLDDIYVDLCNQLDSARKGTVIAIAMTSKFAPKGPLPR
jgi:hypothetical protein